MAELAPLASLRLTVDASPGLVSVVGLIEGSDAALTLVARRDGDGWLVRDATLPAVERYPDLVSALRAMAEGVGCAAEAFALATFGLGVVPEPDLEAD
ncbi:MAG: hypothetical protein IT201_14520 [Thermoleophilia bacterium]|nr:hypothetical protein [Thermoleophilia bacterium]